MKPLFHGNCRQWQHGQENYFEGKNMLCGNKRNKNNKSNYKMKGAIAFDDKRNHL